MSDLWRLVDTGLRSAAQNVALSRAMLEARRADEIAGTLRFARYAPSVLLGVQQSAQQELNLDYCRANLIPVQRRITGGGAAYVSEAQLAWELLFHQRDLAQAGMSATARRIGHAVATAIAALDIAARYRARGEIEVDGRSVASVNGTRDGDAVLFQGVVHLDLDLDRVLGTQRMAAADSKEAAIVQARQRMAGLTDILGHRPDALALRRYVTEAFESELNVEFREAELTLSENARYRAALAAVEARDWIELVSTPASDAPDYHAAHRCAAGVLKVSLIYDKTSHRIKQIRYTGDIAVTPACAVANLEAALQDTQAERLEHNVSMFFASLRPDMPHLTPADFIAVARRALQRTLVTPDRP